MTLDEMRDEFERDLAAHLKLPQAPAMFKAARSDDRYYANCIGSEATRGQLEIGWWAWQSARAAVLVDMPKMEYFEVVAEMRQQSLTRAWAKIRNLRKEVDQHRANADRYVWLRDKSESVHAFYLSTPIWFSGVTFRPEDVDRSIEGLIGEKVTP